MQQINLRNIKPCVSVVSGLCLYNQCYGAIDCRLLDYEREKIIS